MKINNGSGTFKVDENGNVVANKLSSKSATITGGSINIQTSSQNTSAIQLSHNEWTLKVSPLEIRIDNSTIGGHIVLQAGAMSGYWNNELKFSLDTNSGNISTYTDSGKKYLQLIPITGRCTYTTKMKKPQYNATARQVISCATVSLRKTTH